MVEFIHHLVTPESVLRVTLNEKQISFLRMQIVLAFRNGVAKFDCDPRVPTETLEHFFKMNPFVHCEVLIETVGGKKRESFQLTPCYGVANSTSYAVRMKNGVPPKCRWKINQVRETSSRIAA